VVLPDHSHSRLSTANTPRFAFVCWLALLMMVSTTAMARSGPLVSTLQLLSQTPAIGAGQTFTLRLEVEGIDLREPTIEVAVFESIASPDTLDRILDKELDQPLDRVRPTPFGGYSVDATGHLTVRVRLGTGSDDDGPAADQTLDLPEPGVYPLVITVSSSSGASATLRTTLIHLGDPAVPAPSPIPVAILFDVGAAEPESFGIEQATDLLTARPELPLTVVLRRAGLATLEQDPTLRANFAAAMAGRRVVGEPGHQLDPSALAGIDQGRLLQVLLDQVTAELAAVGLTADRSTTINTNPLTMQGADLLTSLGIGTVLSDESMPVGGTDAPRPAAPRPTRLGTIDGSVVLLSTGPGRAPDPRAGVEGAVLRAHRLLARLVLEHEAGATLSKVVAGGVGGEPPAVLDRVIEALAASSRFRLVTTDADQADDPTPTGAQIGKLSIELGTPATGALQDLSAVADPLAQSERDLRTYSSFFLGGPGSPQDYRMDLSLALATDLDDGQRSARVRAVIDQVSAELGVISFPPDQSFTVAARSASIPLTVDNAAAGPRQVQLRFRSDKFVIANAGSTITLEPGTNTVDVALEARSLGASPLSVSVLSADGEQVLAGSRLQVRSTAVPGLGLALAGLGMGLLALWWFVSIRRTRADRREPGSRTGAGAGTGSGEAGTGATDLQDVDPGVAAQPEQRAQRSRVPDPAPMSGSVRG